jgi:hypothetical protein
MSDDDNPNASADGITQCLRLLAEEAAALKLGLTLTAIQKALAIVMMEGSHATGLDTHTPGPRLH